MIVTGFPEAHGLNNDVDILMVVIGTYAHEIWCVGREQVNALIFFPLKYIDAVINDVNPFLRDTNDA